MEKPLLSAIMEGQGSGGGSVLATAKFAVLPIVKVFTMCFMGFLMASKYVNILPANGRKLLNGLVFTLLLPCLIFSQLGRAISLQKLLQWWYIPVNVVLGSISGSLIGFIVASIVRPPYPYFKFTIIHIGIDLSIHVCLFLHATWHSPYHSLESSDSPGIYPDPGVWTGVDILMIRVAQRKRRRPVGVPSSHDPLLGSRVSLL